ncbi:hypothetical protein HMPREF9136_2577 [Prevotella dentalis DSM 3688]|uniref:Uncharacterized protein n=1 Tax=Prevotella dentalis (strain ATCC 49559 / DSM 3688 / JCM 13448 / NCTC 12043 / ES 2772) TaxID=908937 RepID=F9D6U9_PREDD|nr:hypothetical protein HMPREF9136_2577 [Prevotella dentalis DSM 3688]
MSCICGIREICEKIPKTSMPLRAYGIITTTESMDIDHYFSNA